MTDKQTIEPCMGCSALESWGVVDCDVAQRVLALHKTLTEIKEIASKVLLNTHDLEQFKDADALFGALLEIHKKISECEGNDE